jgi:hypothetical protein
MIGGKMSKFITKTLFLLVLLIFLSFQASTTQINNPKVKRIDPIKSQSTSKNLQVNLDYGKIPLYFIPNKGQVNDQALFYAKASRYILWLTSDGLVFDSIRRIEKEGTESERKFLDDGKKPESVKWDRDVSRIRFLNANKCPEIVAVDMTEHRVNYFIGDDKTNWRRDIRTSKSVVYKGIYKNIDLKVYGIEKEIEYDWVVMPGGDVRDIRFEYEGMIGTKLDGEGNLVVRTKFGEVIHKRPESYQMIDGHKLEVDMRFIEEGENIYGFEVGKYSEDHELVIDPVVLVYSTYLGGSQIDASNGIAVDSAGNAYVTGQTESTDFPAENAYMTDPGDSKYDAFVTKLSASGNALVYSTYLGGNDFDEGNGIAVDDAGIAFVTGRTNSTDFPLMNAYMSHAGDADVFVTKLSASGNVLVYSTYLGGSSADIGNGIAVDSQGYAYVTGGMWSSDYPTVNAYMTDPGDGSSDVFVTKLSASGNALVYSTYLGGDEYDEGHDIAVDSAGNAYVTGSTSSTDFPTHNHYMTDSGDAEADAFVTAFKRGGSSLWFSTYLGGNSLDQGFGIAIIGFLISDLKIPSSVSIYIAGRTDSTDFPTVNALMTDPGDSWEDGFVSNLKFVHKSTISILNLIYSTYLGGSYVDRGFGIAVDNQGYAYVTGQSISTDFPTVNAPMTDAGSSDAFVTKISTSGNSLVYSTYLGGDANDRAGGIAVDNAGNAYVTGDTLSTNFPTVSAYMTHQAEYDTFVTKLMYINPYVFDGHDFNGNGSSDVSIYRPSNGRWYIRGIGSYVWGAIGDIPVNGDYNGDGTTDIAVWRPSNGWWYLKGIGGSSWGTAGDVPVPGNYDGDVNRKTDIAVWRPTNGRWYIKGVGGYVWGTVGDIPVPGDYDGDGTTEIAVWRPSNGRWYIQGVAGSVWGTISDVPIPADYNGDGITDIAVWRPSNGRWYIKGIAGSVWGTAGDIPAPGDYNGDGITDIAVWRPSNGRWYIKGIGGYLWGTLGDIPLVR